jgi:twinfilin-like protein
MHRSGIKVDEDLKKDFASAQQDSKVLYIEIGIQNESFKRRAIVNGAVDSKSWAVLASALKKQTPTYLVTRVGAASNKWLLIFYVPEDSIVREKMVYASSVSALKEGLGSNLFAQSDYSISTQGECTEAGFDQAMKVFTKDEILTSSETAKQEAKEQSSKEASVTKQQAMADIPLVVDDDANKEIAKLKEGKVDLVVLAIDAKTEVLHHKGSAQKITVEEIAKSTTHLPSNEARYLFYRYAHSFEEKAQTPVVFLYYRPENSSLKSKMTYSAMKQNVARIAEKMGIEITKSYEFSESNELTSSVLLQELYPKSSEKKAFTKPRKPGKGAGGLVGGVKFSAK